MQVGTYIDGRALDYDESTGQFSISGIAVAGEDLAAYVQAGQITWTGDETREWYNANFAAPHAEPDKSRRGGKYALPLAIVIAAVILSCGACSVVALLTPAAQTSSATIPQSAQPAASKKAADAAAAKLKAAEAAAAQEAAEKAAAEQKAAEEAAAAQEAAEKAAAEQEAAEAAAAAAAQKKAAAAAAAKQKAAAEREETVYVTRTGEKYHRAGCQYLRQSQIPISLSDAQQSYTPCSRCF